VHGDGVSVVDPAHLPFNKLPPPVHVETVKINGKDVAAALERDGWYARWQQVVYDSSGAGDLLWMIGSREPKVAGNRDDYTVYSAGEIPSVAAHGSAMWNRGKAAGI
jgi:hypothetical protein